MYRSRSYCSSTLTLYTYYLFIVLREEQRQRCYLFQKINSARSFASGILIRRVKTKRSACTESSVQSKDELFETELKERRTDGTKLPAMYDERRWGGSRAGLGPRPR